MSPSSISIHNGTRLILRSLMRLQPCAQVVVATHSPEIYDAAASYERHYLVSGG